MLHHLFYCHVLISLSHSHTHTHTHCTLLYCYCINHISINGNTAKLYSTVVPFIIIIIIIFFLNFSSLPLFLLIYKITKFSILYIKSAEKIKTIIFYFLRSSPHHHQRKIIINCFSRYF